MHYEGNWWSKFDPEAVLPPHDLQPYYTWWFDQRPLLPKPQLFPMHVSFELTFMLEQDLRELKRVLEKMAEDMDADMDTTQSELTRLTVCIAKAELQILELKRHEDEALADQEARIQFGLAGDGEEPLQPGDGAGPSSSGGPGVTS